MHRHTLLVIALLGVMAVPAWAQQDYRVEISAFGGYTFSEGVPVTPAEVDGELSGQIAPVSGGSYGMNTRVFLSEQASFGFQFAQQLSTLEGKGRTKREFVDLKMNNYHGIFTCNMGYGDGPLRPFIFGGLGATQYSPGDFEGLSVDGETRFSTTWGGGVNFRFQGALLDWASPRTLAPALVGPRCPPPAPSRDALCASHLRRGRPPRLS